MPDDVKLTIVILCSSKLLMIFLALFIADSLINMSRVTAVLMPPTNKNKWYWYDLLTIEASKAHKTTWALTPSVIHLFLDFGGKADLRSYLVGGVMSNWKTPSYWSFGSYKTAALGVPVIGSDRYCMFPYSVQPYMASIWCILALPWSWLMLFRKIELWYQ